MADRVSELYTGLNVMENWKIIFSYFSALHRLSKIGNYLGLEFGVNLT